MFQEKKESLYCTINTCTMDFSIEQLDKDKMIAEREKININTVQDDMIQPFPFKDNSFNIVFSPVSNAYIEDLENMWKESYRVLKQGNN